LERRRRFTMLERDDRAETGQLVTATGPEPAVGGGRGMGGVVGMATPSRADDDHFDRKIGTAAKRIRGVLDRIPDRLEV
jgi:hypothetical protein